MSDGAIAFGLPAKKGRGLQAVWQRWAHAAAGLVFAPDCACCQCEAAPEPGAAVCGDCRRKLLYQSDISRCRRCAGPISAFASSRAGCLDCTRRKPRFEQTRALGSYQGELRRAILTMKHTGQEALTLAVADLMVERLGPAIAELRCDLLAPVPMHWRRRWQRGVNSPELLAERLAYRLSLPLARRLLVRTRHTPRQTDLPSSQRTTNVRGAFRLGREYRLHQARILLVDDVLTTGATSSEAAGTLRRHGARSVCVCIVARAD